MVHPYLRPVEPGRFVDLARLPPTGFWCLSSDGCGGWWVQLGDGEPAGPYPDAQHAVDELAELARREPEMAAWQPGEPDPEFLPPPGGLSLLDRPLPGWAMLPLRVAAGLGLWLCVLGGGWAVWRLARGLLS